MVRNWPEVEEELLRWGLQLAAVECRHQEAFRKIIKMLCQRQDIEILASCRGIHDAALHAGTPAAVGITSHVIACTFQQRLLFQKPGDLKGIKIGPQRCQVEAVNHRVHGHHAEFEPYRRMAMQMQQYMQQCQGILATGDAQQDTVTGPYHVEIMNCAPDRAQQ